ncbi:VOC family protein [Dyadobacter fanqingshengii]|uniref:VOC family protein n=1 Tax=Dyadobacter fanqingshengii TaxID=2906443 RepID=A0A9X1T9R8_9BACT|nr:VOC family protein [Dyadobacter fanqingshengii]MCF0041600.1 VOC family protein [Dyadobacter fanqingshengii]MCF2505266.1 VOC family protein [Dyadobacter fanqingshengii]USJ36683.1 VOC family protein [Dyadobacter fanqingshengii]
MNLHQLGPHLAVIVPTLTVRNCSGAITFYQTAFAATVLMSNTDPDGSTVAELEIMGARFVVADESEEHNLFSPEKLHGTPVRIGLQVVDPDQLFARAIGAGALIIYPVADQDYGYRLGHLVDPFGHHWEIFKPLT